MTIKARKKTIRITTAGHQRVGRFVGLFCSVSIANRRDFTGSRAGAKAMRIKELPSFLGGTARFRHISCFWMTGFL